MVEGSHHAARASLTGRRAPGHWRVAVATSHGVDIDRKSVCWVGLRTSATSVCLHCLRLCPQMRKIESELTNWMCAASAASQPGLSTNDTPWEHGRCAISQDCRSGYPPCSPIAFPQAIPEQVMRNEPTTRWIARVCAVLQPPLACPSSTCPSRPLASRVEPHLGPTVDVRRNSALSELSDEASCRHCGSQSISGCSNAAWRHQGATTAKHLAVVADMAISSSGARR